jgi:hypothetical protein
VIDDAPVLEMSSATPEGTDAVLNKDSTTLGELALKHTASR